MTGTNSLTVNSKLGFNAHNDADSLVQLLTDHWGSCTSSARIVSALSKSNSGIDTHYMIRCACKYW